MMSSFIFANWWCSCRRVMPMATEPTMKRLLQRLETKTKCHMSTCLGYFEADQILVLLWRIRRFEEGQAPL